jgi:hypothetical protein
MTEQQEQEQQNKSDNDRPPARALFFLVRENLVRLEVALVGAWVCQGSSRPYVLQGIADIGPSPDPTDYSLSSHVEGRTETSRNRHQALRARVLGARYVTA